MMQASDAFVQRKLHTFFDGDSSLPVRTVSCRMLSRLLFLSLSCPAVEQMSCKAEILVSHLRCRLV